MNLSKLVNGKIPEKTECPFKKECPTINLCKHNGINHPCVFSCATARFLDIKQRTKKELP